MTQEYQIVLLPSLGKENKKYVQATPYRKKTCQMPHHAS